jgi:hypothetical protein
MLAAAEWFRRTYQNRAVVNGGTNLSPPTSVQPVITKNIWVTFSYAADNAEIP